MNRKGSWGMLFIALIIVNCLVASITWNLEVGKATYTKVKCYDRVGNEIENAVCKQWNSSVPSQSIKTIIIIFGHLMAFIFSIGAFYPKTLKNKHIVQSNQKSHTRDKGESA